MCPKWCVVLCFRVRGAIWEIKCLFRNINALFYGPALKRLLRLHANIICVREINEAFTYGRVSN